MAYVNGSAASFADLKIAIENAAVAAGWTLSSGVLSKNGAFVKLTNNTASPPRLEIQGGTAQSGSTLTNPSPASPSIVNPTSNGTISFPVTYEIHTFTNPDEVYCFINYNSDYYQHLCFGKSDMPGVGVGVWITASWPESPTAGGGLNLSVSKADVGAFPYLNSQNIGLFCDGQWTTTQRASLIYTSLDSAAWRSPCNANQMFRASAVTASLLTALPNLSNQATVLLPIKGVQRRTSGGLTTVLDLQNARLLRIDNLTPGDLVTYGPDQWKVYPWYRKDINNRNGQNTSTSTPRPTHSGTFGFAIKYTGA